MVVDRIIELEIELLNKKRVPTRVLISIANYKVLIKELEETPFLDRIHNMKIEIVKSAQLIVV
jgi:hypothetical protein